MPDGEPRVEPQIDPDWAALRAAGDGAPRTWLPAAWRGWRRRCPACGERTLLKFLKMAPACSHCGEAFEPYRADDAPAYFTILVVGHILVPLVFLSEQMIDPPLPLWMQAAIWLPTTLGLTLWALPRVKGAVIATLWAMKMNGVRS